MAFELFRTLLDFLSFCDFLEIEGSVWVKRVEFFQRNLLIVNRLIKKVHGSWSFFGIEQWPKAECILFSMFFQQSSQLLRAQTFQKLYEIIFIDIQMFLITQPRNFKQKILQFKCSQSFQSNQLQKKLNFWFPTRFFVGFSFSKRAFFPLNRWIFH